MLDLPRMQHITLSAEPIVQRMIGLGFLAPNYNAVPGVRIDLEGVENLPDHPVIFAMNHTDRYNYWPFQYTLWRQIGRFTATWVKGKYYENDLLAWFMEMTNNIPTVSRGYLIAKDFLALTGRPPKKEQYRALRTLIERVAVGGDEDVDGLDTVPREVFERRREVLGLAFDPAGESYASFINRLFAKMVERFVALNEEAFAKGLDVIIFPQGTRSKRLSEGHVGVAQIALRYRRTIVPVGCNGCDGVYPGSSPWGKAGHIVYRIGQPITVEEMAPFAPAEPFQPLTAEAEALYHDQFRGLTDLVMGRINDLLDPEYQFSTDMASDGVADAARFV